MGVEEDLVDEEVHLTKEQEETMSYKSQTNRNFKQEIKKTQKPGSLFGTILVQTV